VIASARSALTLAAAVVGLAIAISACATTVVVSSRPSATNAAGHGTIVVSYERRDAPSQVFNGTPRVRAVDDRGSIVAEAALTDGVRLVVPIGTYRVAIVFVYVADWMSCGPDPAVAGRETCFLPSLSPVTTCSAGAVTVALDAVVALRHRILADGSCGLEAAPASTVASPT
jgi:hypothetical protein